MRRINYKGMYPVYVQEVAKEAIKINNVDEICQFLINKINAHTFAKYIGIFDHYAHTESIEGGKMAESIKDAKNILFCFGKKLPAPEMLAVRPRSIGVCETNSHFVISFLEAPNPALTEIMILWLEDMLNQ